MSFDLTKCWRHCVRGCGLVAARSAEVVSVQVEVTSRLVGALLARLVHSDPRGNRHLTQYQ